MRLTHQVIDAVTSSLHPVKMVPKRARSPTPSSGREWLLAELDTLEQSYKAALHHIGMIMRFHADIRKAGLQKQVLKAPSHLIIGLARETDKWETAKRRVDYYLRKTYRLTSQSVAPSPELHSQPLSDDKTVLPWPTSQAPEQPPLSLINPLLAAHLKTPLGQSSPVPLATAKVENIQSSFPNPSPAMSLPNQMFTPSNPSPADILSSLQNQNTSQPPQPVSDDQLNQLQSFMGSDLGGEMDFSGIDMSALEGLFPGSGTGATPQAGGDGNAAELEQLQAFLNQNQSQETFNPPAPTFSNDTFNQTPTFASQPQTTTFTQSQEDLSMFSQPTEAIQQPQAIQPQQLQQLQSVQQPQQQQNQTQPQQQPQVLSGLGLDMGNPSDGLQMGPEELELLLAGWQE